MNLFNHLIIFPRLIKNGLWGVNIWKTIYYNLKVFPFPMSIKLPLYIYKNTTVKFKKGSISFPKSMHSGAIKIGIRLSHFIDKHEETIFISDGKIEFKGNCTIGSGAKIAVSKKCRLSVGENFNETGRFHVCCETGIRIGDNCMFSWDVTLIDTDYHPIKDENRRILNAPRAISIGNHVWIGCNTMILKGVNIPDNNIIAAGSIIRGSLSKSNSIFGTSNSDIKCFRENITWTKGSF